MGIMQRNKGKVGERELAHELSRLFGVDAYRGRQYHGRDDAPDVVVDIPGVHIECKRTERLSLYRAMQQAIDDAGDNVPVVMHRSNRKPWLAVVRLDDLPALAVQLYLTMAANK